MNKLQLKDLVAFRDEAVLLDPKAFALYIVETRQKIDSYSLRNSDKATDKYGNLLLNQLGKFISQMDIVNK